MKNFADWMLNGSEQRQILMTSHNPAILDGLPLQDDRVGLFTVARDNKGKTVSDHFRRHPHPYVERQVYLYPHPPEMMLNQHI